MPRQMGLLGVAALGVLAPCDPFMVASPQGAGAEPDSAELGAEASATAFILGSFCPGLVGVNRGINKGCVAQSPAICFNNCPAS